MMRTYLDFEKTIAELENKVAELRALTSGGEDVSFSDEIAKLEAKTHDALQSTYSKLSPWQKTQVARHPQRPHFVDYLDALLEELTPLAGERYFAEDFAMIGGLGRFQGRPIMIIGQV